MDRQNPSELTPEQYESVLKYMEATSQENFEAATAALRLYHFNINTAINARFGTHLQEQQFPLIEDNDRPNDEEVVEQYVQFLRQKQQNFSIVFGVYSYVKGFVVGIFKGVSELICKFHLMKVPQFLKKKWLRSSFHNFYADNLKVELTEGPLQALFKKSSETRKPIMFVIASVENRHNSVIQLLNQPRIAKKINESYLFAGALENDEKVSEITNQKRPPTIIVLRRNVFEKVQMVEKYVGNEQIAKITVQQLNRVLHQHQNMCRRDRNVQIKYRNHVRRIQYGGYAGFYQEQEEQLFPDRVRATSTMIQQQNEDYRRIEQESMKRLQEQQAQQQQKLKLKQIQQELQEERKVRKLSIPDEPDGGEIIRINFRCPDGSTRSRNFQSDEKVELIYNWVETNEQIEFEDNSKRAFQLLYSFPPTPLCERKDQLLKSVFESDQEKVMIREL